MMRIWTGIEQKLWTFVLWLGCAVVYSARTSLPLCIPIIAKQLGWNKEQSGLVMSSFFFGYALTQVGGGYAADKVGGEAVMMIAALIWSGATLVTPVILHWFAVSSNPPVIMFIILGLRLAMGAAQGVHYPSISSITSKHCKDEQRTLIYGTICAGSHIGTLIAGSLGSFVLVHVGWEFVFYMIGCFGIAWILLLYWMMRRYKLRSCRHLLNTSTTSSSADVNDLISSSSSSSDATVKLLPHDTTTSQLAPSSASAAVPWRILLTHPAFWSMVTGHVCKNYFYFTAHSWMPMYFTDNYPNHKAWIYNVIPWIAVFPICVLGGYIANRMIADKVNTTLVRKLLETIAMLGCAFFLFLLQYTSSFTSALLCLTVAVAINGFHNSGILVIVNPQDIAPKYAGSVFGAMNMAGALPGFVGVYIAGWMLSGEGGEWSGVFNLTSLVLCIGWASFTICGTAKQIV